MSSLDVAVGSVLVNTTGSVSFPVSMIPSDLALITVRQNGSNAMTVVVNGVTLTQYMSVQNGLGGVTVRVYAVTGLTGTHSETVTVPSVAGTALIGVNVAHGLLNTAIKTTAQSTWNSGTTAANTDEGPTPISVGNGQAVVAVGIGSGTVTFPSNPTPASGWTTDRGGTSPLASRVFTATEPSMQVNIRAASTVAIAVLEIVLGDEITASPPLASTFIGWGNPIF